ncbi:MAG: AzlC family ABC transporter permease [Candidatus Bathyarchaeia archaeon]
MSKTSKFLEGFKATAPLSLGIASFGIAYGILARKAGLSIFTLTLMSLLVFAGTAQFLTISMLITGTPFIIILFTTFIVNSRYFLMGASIGSYTRKWGTRWQILLSFLLCDESYALTTAYFSKNGPDKYYQLGVSLGLYIEWALFSVIGGLMGSFLGNPQTWGLDFALPATFIVLLVPMITTWKHVTVCLATAVFSTVGLLFLPTKWYIPFATVLGTVVGGILEFWKRK